MIERKSVSVSLTPQLHAFVGELVAAGAYGNVSEVVRAGLRLLQHDEASRRDGAGSVGPRADDEAGVSGHRDDGSDVRG